MAWPSANAPTPAPSAATVPLTSESRVKGSAWLIRPSRINRSHNPTPPPSRRLAPLLPPAPAGESRPAACYRCRRTREFEWLSLIVPSLVSRKPIWGQRRHIREERAEALRHRRVGDNGIAELRVWETGQRRRLHHGHDLAGLCADHCKAENAVIARTFIKPCVSSVVAVRRTAFIGSFATRAAIPWRFASSSLNPTWARGGSVNMQYGTRRSRVLRLPPERLSLMMRKSSSDACVNCGLPAHSPIAQTLGAVVSSRSLTRM